MLKKYVFGFIFGALCFSARAEAFSLYGVRLGEVLSLPACTSKTDGMTDKLPEVTCYVDDEIGKRPNEIEVYFAQKDCPIYTFGCAFVAFVGADNRVVGYRVSTGGQGAKDAALNALVKKFGKPSQVASDLTQNRMGAKYYNQFFTWIKAGYRVSFQEFFGSLDEGRIIIETPIANRLISAAQVRPEKSM